MCSSKTTVDRFQDFPVRGLLVVSHSLTRPDVPNSVFSISDLYVLQSPGRTDPRVLGGRDTRIRYRSLAPIEGCRCVHGYLIDLISGQEDRDSGPERGYECPLSTRH